MRKPLFLSLILLACTPSDTPPSDSGETASASCSGLELATSQLAWDEQTLLETDAYSSRFGTRELTTVWQDGSEHLLTLQLDWATAYLELHDIAADPNGCANAQLLPSYHVVATVTVSGDVGVSGSFEQALEVRPEHSLGPQELWYPSIPVALTGQAASIAGRSDAQVDVAWGLNSTQADGVLPVPNSSPVDTSSELFRTK